MKYHLVWIPKYHKFLLFGSIERRLKELFCEIAEEHDFEILGRELVPDYVHLFVSADPKRAPGKILDNFEILMVGEKKTKQRSATGHRRSTTREEGAKRETIGSGTIIG